MNQKKKIIISLIIGIILISTAGIIFRTLNDNDNDNLNSNEIRLMFSIVPDDATIKIDGNLSEASTKLAKGEHTIEISRFGFSNFILKKNFYKDENLFVNMTGVSEEAIKWQQENNSLYLTNEALSGEDSEKTGEEFAVKHPIVSVLPINNSPFYIIGFKIDDKNDDIILTIRANQENRRNAIDEIYFKGFDPSDYKIEFIDPKATYVNPFTGGAN